MGIIVEAVIVSIFRQAKSSPIARREPILRYIFLLDFYHSLYKQQFGYMEQ